MASVARHLVGSGEPVVLAAKDESQAEALPHELGPLARRLRAGRDRRCRRRRLRCMARHDQGPDREACAPAREQGRRRPLEPARVRRERADASDTARRPVSRLDRADVGNRPDRRRRGDQLERDLPRRLHRRWLRLRRRLPRRTARTRREDPAPTPGR